MEIKEGLVKFDKSTKEINIYVESNIERKKALILEAKQNSLGRTYITVK